MAMRNNPVGFSTAAAFWNGKFPLWLSPVKVKILSISDKYMDYAKEVEMILKKEGLRCEVDGRAEKIGCKIRTARLERIPYMLVIGEKEVKANSVSVRKREMREIWGVCRSDNYWKCFRRKESAECSA